MADQVTTATYRLNVVGLENIKRADDLLSALSVTQESATASATGLAAANNNTGSSFERVSGGARTSTDQLTRFVATLDKATRAEVQYQQGLDKIAKFSAAGVGSETQLAQAVELVTKRRADQIASLNKVTGATNDNATAAGKATVSIGATKAAVQNLSFQLNDIGTSLASGSSPLRVLAQQGGQIIQAFQQGGGVGAVLGDIGTKIKAIGVGTIGAVAAVAAFAGGITFLAFRALETADRLRQFKVSLDALGTGSAGVTPETIERMARSLRDMGVAADVAFESVRKLSTDVGINPAAIENIAKAGTNIGAVLGTGPAAGITQLQEALKTTESIIKLGNQLNALRPGEEAQIRTLDRLQGSAAAISRAYQDIVDTVDGSFKKSLSESQKASQETTNSWNRLLDKLSDTKAFQTAGDALRQLFTLPGALAAAGAGSAEVNTEGMPFAPGAGGAPAATGPQRAIVPVPGRTGGGGGGRVSFVGNAAGQENASEAIRQLTALLNDASSVLKEGQRFAVFSAVRPGSTTLHSPGAASAVDVRIVDNTGRAVETGVSGRPTMGGGGLPGPDVDRAMIAAADRLGVRISVGSRFSDPDPGHYGIGANREVAQNQARQADLRAGGGPSPVPAQTEAEKTATAAVTADLVRQREILRDEVELRGKSGVELEATRRGQEAYREAMEKTHDETLATQAADLARKKILEESNQEARRTTSLNELQLSLSKDIAAAWGRSAKEGIEAEATAQATLEVYQKTGSVANSRAKIEERTTQLIIAQATAERDRNARDLKQQHDNQDVLKLQISLQGQSTEEITKQVTLLQGKQQIEKEFPFLTEKEKENRLATVAATADLTKQLAEAEREQQKLNSAIVSIGETIDTNIVQALEGAFDSKKVIDFAAVAKQALTSIVSQLANSLLIRPAIGTIIGGLGFGQAAQSFGSFGGSSSSGGTGTSTSGGGLNTGTLLQGGGLLKDLFGDSIGLKGVGGFFNNIGSRLGFATGPDIATGVDIPGSLFGSTTFGQALGGVGLGFTAGSLLNSVLGGNTVGGTVGSGVGAIAGTVIGSLVGGPIIGGLLGGLGGGALGGLFGNTKPPNLASGGILNLGTGQISGVQSSGNAQNDATAQKIGQALSSAVTRALQIPGAILPAGAAMIQAGSRDGIKLGFGSQQGTFKTAEEAIAAGLIFLRDNLTGVSETVHKVLQSVSDPNDIENALAFAQAYEELAKASDDAFTAIEEAQRGPYQQALESIRATFDAITQNTIKYGLSLDPVNKALEEATKRVNVDFAKAVDRSYNAATGGDFLNNIQDIIDQYKQATKDASFIGADASVHGKLGDTVTAQLQSVLETLSGPQLDKVIATFGDLGITTLPSMARAAKEAADAAQALTDQMLRQTAAYQVQQDYDNARGAGYLAQLRDLDRVRQASQQQAQALNLGAGPVDMIAATQHQASLTILRELNNDQLEESRKVLADLNPAFATWVDEAKNLLQVSQDAAKATQDQADAEARRNQILAAGLQIRQYLNSLETGTDFTSPLSRLTAARQQYATQIGLAQGGDVTALQGITQVADTLKQALLGYFASSPAGSAEFEEIKRQLALLPGVPNATQTQTNAIVDAITDTGQKTVAAVAESSTASAQQIVATTIATNAEIVDGARTTSREIIAATGESSASITANAISTGRDIVANAAAGSAAIVGASTVGTQTLEAATIQTTAAASNTAAAVAAGTVATNQGTISLLNSNQANAATLIAGSKEDTGNLLRQQEANSSALLASNEAQSSTLVAQNIANAQAVVATTNATAADIVAANDDAAVRMIATAHQTTDEATAAARANSTDIVAANDDAALRIISTAQQTTADATAAAKANSIDVVGTVGAWGNATVSTVAAWGQSDVSYQAQAADATVGTITGWGNATCNTIAAWGQSDISYQAQAADSIVNMLAAVGNAITNSVFSSSSNEIGATYGSSSNEIGAAFANGNSIIGALGSLSTTQVAAIYSSSNSIIAEIAWAMNLEPVTNAIWTTGNGTNSALAYIADLENNAQRGSDYWSQNIFNVIADMSGRMQEWNARLYGELVVIREYMNLLTEVTIQFDEYSAAQLNANIEQMTNIEVTLRRQAFG